MSKEDDQIVQWYLDNKRFGARLPIYDNYGFQLPRDHFGGSTLVSGGDRIDNDNNKVCFAIGAYRLGPVYIPRELYTAMTPKPGFLLDMGPGAASVDERYYETAADGSALAYAISEFDKGMVANADTAYAAGDEIPGIPIHLNIGAMIRNMHCADPVGQAVSPNHAMTSKSGTVGLIKAVTEPTLATEADNLGFNAGASVGDEGATGTTIIGRIYARQAYYLADPNNPYQDVVYLVMS